MEVREQNLQMSVELSSERNGMENADPGLPVAACGHCCHGAHQLAAGGGCGLVLGLFS